MNGKRILIVDDEAAILSVLKSSLKKLGAGYEVFIALNGQEALEQLGQYPFDLVITDYKMAGMDGLELIEAVRSLQPGARTILMTAYGNDKVEAEAQRLQAYRYLVKPLEIDIFRQIVQSALKDIAISRPGILILSGERYKEIVLSLDKLRMEVGARCVVLADAEGSSIACAGNLDKFPLEKVVPLLGGCIAGVGEAGRVLNGEDDAINLIYRESTTENLYAINIGAQLLLIIVVDRGPYNSKLGTVWYSAQQVASMLFQKLGEKEYANPQDLFDSRLEKAVGDGLDKLLFGSHAGEVENNSNELRMPHSNPCLVQSQNEGITKIQSSLLTFDQAVEAGLIPQDISGSPNLKGRVSNDGN